MADLVDWNLHVCIRFRKYGLCLLLPFKFLARVLIKNDLFEFAKSCLVNFFEWFLDFLHVQNHDYIQGIG